MPRRRLATSHLPFAGPTPDSWTTEPGAATHRDARHVTVTSLRTLPLSMSKSIDATPGDCSFRTSFGFALRSSFSEMNQSEPSFMKQRQLTSSARRRRHVHESSRLPSVPPRRNWYGSAFRRTRRSTAPDDSPRAAAEDAWPRWERYAPDV